MLKVLFLASWYPNKEHPISGIFVKRHALAVSKYCDVAVLYIHLGDVEENIEIAKEDGLTEVRIYKKKPKNNSRYMKIFYNYVQVYMEYLLGGLQGYKIIEREFGRPDLAQVNVILYSGIIGLALKILKGIPYVVMEHWAGYLKEDGTFQKRSSFGKYLIRAIGKRAAAIITVSSSLKDAMRACGIENKYFVVPNVVEMPPCKEEDGDTGNSGKKKILHISLLKDDVKNVSGIIEATKTLHDKRDDFKLHIIGDGNDRLKLENLAENLGLLNEVVFFHGMLSEEEVKRQICSSTFSVINSNFETFSVSAAESLACGKPVVVTRCGGPEGFVNERCGILVVPKDTSGLARAMECMLDSCENYDSNAIGEYARSCFSSERIGRQIYEIYRSIIKP